MILDSKKIFLILALLLSPSLCATSNSNSVYDLIIIIGAIVVFCAVFITLAVCCQGRSRSPKYGEKLAASYYKPPGMEEAHPDIPPDFPPGYNFSFYALQEYFKGNNFLAQKARSQQLGGFNQQPAMTMGGNDEEVQNPFDAKA